MNKMNFENKKNAVVKHHEELILKKNEVNTQWYNGVIDGIPDKKVALL